jgi:hypothetical protein
VVAPLDQWGEIVAELNRAGGAIECAEPSDPARISARIPAAALKALELWISKQFGGRATIELQAIEQAADSPDSEN